MPSINLKESNNVEEFFDVLSPRTHLEKGSDYIYRGQRDATWGLVPKVFRDNLDITRKMYNFHVPSVGVNITVVKQGQLEHEIIQLFVQHCDLLGLSIPTDSAKLRNDHLYNNHHEWPDEALIDILALAQHHGVPTRLLDWTYRAHVAAYFAALADSDEKDSSNDDKIAVWALNLSAIEPVNNVNLHAGCNAAIVRVPGSTSKNLSAQSSVFIITTNEKGPNETFEAINLEDIYLTKPKNPLWKITLPKKYSKDVLRICNLYGISTATMFPGFDGAAKAVNDFINNA